jgi:hypothetical protein
MGFNLKVKAFNEELVGLINRSDLPPIVVRYALSDALSAVNTLTEQEIENELKEEGEKSGESIQPNQLAEPTEHSNSVRGYKPK